MPWAAVVAGRARLVRRRFLVRAGLVLAAAAAVLLASLTPVPAARLRPVAHESLRLVDRHGFPLGEALTSGETSAGWVALERISPFLPAAAVAIEDRRFWSHAGIDPVAVVRAAWANLKAGRVVQGGSTLTQQLARLVLADEARAAGSTTRGRGLALKLREAHLALRLERSFTKPELLEAWLNRVPMGGVAVGVGAGAERWFGVGAGGVSLAQAALLAGLPRGPSALRPDREPSASRRRRDRVLDALEASGLVTGPQAAAARAERVEVLSPRTKPLRPRVGAWVARELGEEGRPVAGEVRVTIDAALEARVQDAVRERLAPLRARGVESAAVVVLDHETDEVLALVGSADETDPRWGQVHAAFALRQPGSALKPFVYLAAMEQGATLATLAADVSQAFPDRFGAWLPRNYDERFHGPVRYREALAQSLNVAAVDVLRTAGLTETTALLERLGFSSIARRPAHYGLGLTLGSLDVQLLELVEAYAVLARGGVLRPPRIRAEAPVGEPVRVVDPQLAWLVSDALSDPQARANQFGARSVLRTPYWSAVKTGTSKGFRDNWCVGYSRRFTVGVWVGDPAGKPMDHVTGVTGAGPIWRDVMDLLAERAPSPSPDPPAGLESAEVCPLSGARAGPHCPGTKREWFAPSTTPTHTCTFHREVRLSNADGLPVPDDCPAPAGPPAARTLFPSPFDLWAVDAREGIPDAVSASCPPPPVPPGVRPALLSPAPLEGIRLDPQVAPGTQELPLLARVEGPFHVTFLVDGVPAGRATGPRSALWRVVPGRHEIVARLHDGTTSEPHVVVVR